MRFKGEPVIVVAAIVTAVQSILAALVLLHVVQLDAEQIAGIILAVQGVLTVPAAFLLRSKVKPWPPDRPEWVPEPFAELDDHILPEGFE